MVIGRVWAGAAAADASVELTVDPTCLRLIDGVGPLDRDALFGLCDAGRGFDRRIDSPERMEYLLGDLDIRFGRLLGPVNSVTKWNKIVQEDTGRPGYADVEHLRRKANPEQPTGRFRQLTGGRLDIAAHGSHNAFPEFMGVVTTPEAEKDNKKHVQHMPENLEAAAELSAAVMAYTFSDFDRPRYYEPVNEPHWSFSGKPHLAEWHTKTKAAVQAKAPEVLVGGPCYSVAYFYKRDFGAFNGLRDFIDHTDCALDFYSFHVYDYMNWNGSDLVGRVSTGLPTEGVLDLVQAYTVNQHGKPVDIVISEHGGYINAGGSGYSAEEVGEHLAAKHFPDGSGFEHTMRKRSIASHVLVSSAIANTMVFMDHPHVVKKAVPFILLESMAWDPEYYSTLYTPYEFTDKDRWVESRNIDFYKFFRDVRGQRVLVTGGDPDLQARAFVDGNRLLVVVNNLSDQPETLKLNLPEADAMGIRRYGRNEDFTPYLTDDPLESADAIEIAGREAVLIVVGYAEPIATTRTVNEVPCYGDAVAVKPDGRRPASFQVQVENPGQVAYATLRIGVTRPAHAAPDLKVVVNGKRVRVPLEDAAQRLTSEDQEYASTKLIPLDPTLLRERNTIQVGFPDEDGGAIGTVVIRAGYEQ